MTEKLCLGRFVIPFPFRGTIIAAWCSLQLQKRSSRLRQREKPAREKCETNGRKKSQPISIHQWGFYFGPSLCLHAWHRMYIPHRRAALPREMQHPRRQEEEWGTAGTWLNFTDSKQISPVDVMTCTRLAGMSVAEKVIKALAFQPEAWSRPASSEAELVWHSRSLTPSGQIFHFRSNNFRRTTHAEFFAIYKLENNHTSCPFCLTLLWAACMSGNKGSSSS